MSNISQLRQHETTITDDQEYKITRAYHSIRALTDMLQPVSAEESDPFMETVRKEDMGYLLSMISEDIEAARP